MRAWRRLMKLPMFSFILGSSLFCVIVLRVRNGDFWRCSTEGEGVDGEMGVAGVLLLLLPVWSRL